MSNPLDLSQLTAVGPFWRAELSVLTLDAPERNLALRALFLDQTRRRVRGQDEVLVPGTLIAICRARRVAVTPASGPGAPSYIWEGSPTPPVPVASFEQMAAAVQTGAVSLLLLAANPDQWPAQPGGGLPTFTCVAGEITLDGLNAQADATGRLTQALGVQPAPAASIRAPGRLCVNASGLALIAQIRLPWLDAASLVAPLQLSLERAPAGAAAPAFRLSLANDRLSQAEFVALTDAAQTLSRAINPHYPRNREADQSLPTPGWVTLELVDPGVPPQLFWPIAPWGSVGDLSFGQGQLNLLLSDRQPYNADAPPSALARLLPDSVTIAPAAGGALTVALRAGQAPPLPVPDAEPAPDGAHYRYQLDASQRETLRLSNITAAYSPVEVAEAIRGAQDLPVPEWSSTGATTLETPLIWGFVPLADGWAQLPVLNLSEQIYIDTGVARLPSDEGAATTPPEPRAAMEGAVSFGNRRVDGSLADAGEHPWSLTISELAGVAAVWTLSATGGSLRVERVELAMARPQLQVNGLLWLSRGRPTPEDALPDLDNWISGLQPVPLRRMRTRVVAGQRVADDLFPALLAFTLESLDLRSPMAPTAPAAPPALDPQLGSWILRYGLANPHVALIPREPAAPPVVTTLVERLVGGSLAEGMPPLLPPDLFARHEALVWRRHPILPAIQALPLTQTKAPPNAPSASRQLAPFALPTGTGEGLLTAFPGPWRFGVAAVEGGARSGAAIWPALLTPVTPAAEWRRLPDLPLAALSLPGLTLDPSAFAAGSGLPASLLPLQYRYDLPYADEVQALAQLPRVEQKRGEVSPLPDDPPPPLPRPLLREAYAAHWGQLAERASLAAADAVEAFGRDDAGQTELRHLVEPLRWPVDAAIDLASYPGQLALREPGATADALVLRGGEPVPDGAGNLPRDPDGEPIPGLSDAALMGVSGQFLPTGDGRLRIAPDDAAAFRVQAGSMAAVRTATGAMRDQRGLSRGPTRPVASLLLTDLELDGFDGSTDRVSLCSTTEVLRLGLGTAEGWQLWFRDLPLRDGQFTRAATGSPLREDVNDPEALAREFNHLNGYEWRLGADETPAIPGRVLRLCGLEFYPLTLEGITVDAGAVATVTLIGRLQLPLDARPQELSDLSAAARLEFATVEGALRLQQVSAADTAPGESAGIWPLALVGGELGGAPRLEWTSLSYDPIAHALELGGAHVAFSLFEQPWRLPVATGAARFTSGLTELELAPQLPESAEAIAPAACTLRLTLIGATAEETGKHSLTLDLAVRLRSAAGETPGTARHGFQATLRFTLLSLKPTGPQLLEAALFDDLVLATEADTTGVQLSVQGQTMQFAWREWLEAPEGLALLPGMPLAPQRAPGCAVVTFATVAGAVAPRLHLTLAYFEAVFEARWGAFLQDETARASAPYAAVFGSSAGDLSLGYAAHLRAEPAGNVPTPATALRWDEQFLFNGFLELKSLISWPRGLAFTRADSTLTLPGLSRGAAPALDHTRHTLRVLLNQHIPPDDTVVLTADPALLFALAADKPWQLLAVVEHQLIDVALPGIPDADAPVALGADRRWTASQEVRLLAPARLQSFLADVGAAGVRTIDPVAGLAPLVERGEGYFDGQLNQLLREALAARAALGPSLFVEASAPHWVRPASLDEARPTTLQFLPGGSQHAILSGPDDYAPGTDRAPHADWLLLQTPFLGRIQPAAHDAAATLLAGDPVLMLQGALAAESTPPLALLTALTNSSVGAPVRLRMAHLDTAAGRSWARLDPLSLDENWFRLHTPLPERPPARLASIAAALPDTPARAGRAVALRRAFDTLRPYVPPRDLRDTPLPGELAYALPAEIAAAELTWRERSLLAASSPQRGAPGARPAVTRGLQLLYSFAEGGGDTVTDSSGVGAPYNLSISNPFAVRWLSGGGLELSNSTALRESGPPTKLIDACRASNAITIEAWIRPQLAGPQTARRIVTLSGPANAQSPGRNVALIQGAVDGPQQRPTVYQAQLRTSSVAASEATALITPQGSVREQLTHLVFTRAADGTRRLYVDGQVVREDVSPGSFSNWDTNFRLALANEVNGNNPWRGTLFMVAVYGEALTPAEIAANRAVFPVVAQGGWRTTAALLSSSGMLDGAPTAPALRRHVAATLLPARLQLERGTPPSSLANPQPLAFAVSPYLGLAFRPRPVDQSLAIVAAELICVEPATGRLRPVATRFFSAGEAGVPDEQLLAWARAQHALLTPESPAAFVRLREIFRGALQDAEEALLAVGFRFLLVSALELPPALRGALTPMRAPARRLRFREGQFGGSLLPEQPAPFELAPPQITGAQPIVLTARPEPATQDGDPVTPPWPWGLSALRFSVRYTDRQRGVVGVQGGGDAATPAPALWWQSLQHGVQFRSALREAPLFSLPLADEAQLQAGPVGAPLRATFAGRGVTLGPEAIVTADAPARWSIHDAASQARYRVRRGDTALRVSRASAPAAGLPPLFRARPIRSLLPLLPDPPLPTADPASWLLPETTDAPRHRYWQPVLPGGLRYALTGTRPGVMVAVRAGLTTQRAGTAASHSAGSAPAQHRSPRPVALPPNLPGRETVALRTWASFFAPEQNMLASAQPVDEAFYGAVAPSVIVPPPATPRPTLPARRLRIRLLNLPHGLVQPNWDGLLLLDGDTDGVSLRRDNLKPALLAGHERFVLRVLRADEALFELGAIADPEGRVQLEPLRAALAGLGLTLDATNPLEQADGAASATARLAGGIVLLLGRLGGGERWSVGEPVSAPERAGRLIGCRPVSAAQAEAIRQQVASVGGGGELTFQLELGPGGEAPGTSSWSFRQLLSLSLRVAAPTAPPLPLRPTYALFEDPEYNRALATQAGRAERMLKLPKPGANQFGLFTLTLASDRRSYNRDSALAIIYSFGTIAPLGQPPALHVRFERVSGAGAPELLRLITEPLGMFNRTRLAHEALLQLQLTDLRRPGTLNRPALEPDDRLRITLFANRESWDGAYTMPRNDEELLSLELEIVREPVIPAPEAAYALLRCQELSGRSEVECVRFAWGPDASRIDLVAREDLLLGVVRRRALFRWRDAARVGTVQGYAVQKIAASGSTHIPLAWEPIV